MPEEKTDNIARVACGGEGNRNQRSLPSLAWYGFGKTIIWAITEGEVSWVLQNSGSGTARLA
jgi:hypothetical protein